MDRLVVDSSVAIKWFVQEPHSDIAQHILDDFRNGKLTLLAPDLLYAELGNIVWKKHRLQGLSLGDATTILQTLQAIPFTIYSSASLLNEAFQFAATYQRTVYDMLYVTLSVREQCPFVTADERLYNALTAQFPFIRWIATY